MVLFFLLSCDSSNQAPVIKVNSKETLDAQQLSNIQTINSYAGSIDTYYFGFDLRASTQEDVAQYLPLLKYLSDKTGYKFQLHFSPKKSSAADELGKNIP